MTFYVSKPKVREAIQWTGENYDEVERFVKIANPPEIFSNSQLGISKGTQIFERFKQIHFWIEKSRVWTSQPIGAWIVKEPDNIGVYPIAEDVFANEYKEYSNWGDISSASNIRSWEDCVDENGYA